MNSDPVGLLGITLSTGDMLRMPYVSSVSAYTLDLATGL
jgi:hypothetical protein